MSTDSTDVLENFQENDAVKDSQNVDIQHDLLVTVSELESIQNDGALVEKEGMKEKGEDTETETLVEASASAATGKESPNIVAPLESSQNFTTQTDIPTPTVEQPPSSISAESFSTRGDVQLRSVGVYCDLVVPTILRTEVITYKRPELWARLPQETAERILAFIVGREEAQAKERSVDPRRTGWLSEGHQMKSADVLIHRGSIACMKSAMLVCKSWYFFLLPQFYAKIVVPSHSNPVRQLIAILPKEPSVQAEKQVNETLVTSSSTESLVSLASTSSTSTSTSSSSASSSVSTPTATSSNEGIQTFGSKVHTLILPETDYAHTHIRPLLKHCPNLHTIHFSRYSPLTSASTTKSFPYYLTASLRRIVEYNAAHTSNDSRVETLIDCFNKAPNVEHLSVSGITLSTVQSQRFLFVWKINKNLIHPASGAKGLGLKELYLGYNCNVGLSFLRGLSESCSNLTSLHIDAGCIISTDTATNGTTSRALDPKDFVRSWGSSLTSLTVVGCSDMPTTGPAHPFDEVLTVCPHLQSLHIRSDHISFDFFRSILTLHSPPVDPFSASEESTEGGKEKPKSRMGLQYLRITHTIPNPGSAISLKDSISLGNQQAILLFARTALELEARGISWPTGFDENGRTSQKDMLNRCAWLMEGIAKKRGLDVGKVGRENDESSSDEE